jgi:hypothetical protein
MFKNKIINLLNKEFPELLNRVEKLALEESSTLADLEKCLEQEIRQLTRPLLESLVHLKAKQSSWVCIKCGQPLRIEARNRTRSVMCSFGEIHFDRDYGWCKKCKSWHYPADEALGLERHGFLSPWMSQRAALLVLKMPSAQAEEISEQILGRAMSRSALHREAMRQGERARKIIESDARRTQSVEGIQALTARSTNVDQSPYTLIIQIDAFNIRERDDWGLTKKKAKKGEEASRWHWTYVGTCFRLDHRGKTASGRPIITHRGYVATREGVESFERQLYAIALQHGLSHAARVVVIADGALWIWNIAQDRYSYAQHRLDLWHLKEHLWNLAHELHGSGTEEARLWVKPLIDQIEKKNHGVIKTIQSLESIRPRYQEKIEVLNREIDYLKNNQSRMDYAQAKKRNEPLGSGAVESTCKQYQCRFKRPGQFWSRSGDEALLSLETLYRNGQWNRLFPKTSKQTTSFN